MVITRDSREGCLRGSVYWQVLDSSVDPSKNSLGSYSGCARGLYTKGSGAQTMQCEKKKQEEEAVGVLWERKQWCYKGSRIRKKHGETQDKQEWRWRWRWQLLRYEVATFSFPSFFSLLCHLIHHLHLLSLLCFPGILFTIWFSNRSPLCLLVFSYDEHLSPKVISHCLVPHLLILPWPSSTFHNLVHAQITIL